jgi:prepilin-type N-terminal cleavage/methylation domain-containing protein/prepilin-type processing-associated H-X9-DG protein
MKLDYRRRAAGRPRRAGFTLLELLAVLFIIAIVVSVLLPTMHKTRRGDGSGRIKCGSNLRQIGQAILLYSNENKGAYPRTFYVPGAPLAFSDDASDGSVVRDPFGLKGVPGRVPDNDVMAAMFLLIRTQDITSEVFVCPNSNAEKDVYGSAAGANAQNKSSFTKWRTNNSYSLANPYPDKTVGVGPQRPDGYRWNSMLGAEFAVAADVNPGVGDGYDVTKVTDTSSAKDMMRVNSPNHQGAGQNVLYGDGHVEFQQNAFCGTKRDHIYTVAGNANGEPTTTSKTVVGSPSWAGDSVLLPPLK